jgi:outer membrane protein
MFRDSTKGTVIILCGVLTFWVFGTLAHATELKIGCVDMQRALNESEAGKKAKVVMESAYGKFQSEIAERRNELQAFHDNLQRQGLMLSEKVKQEKERDYQNKLKEFKRWGEDRQAELKQKEMELTKATLKGLAITVKKLGEEEKFTVILEKNEAILLYTSEAVDLTDRVIKIFNSGGAK